MCVCYLKKSDKNVRWFHEKDKIDPKHSKMPKAEADPTYFLV